MLTIAALLGTIIDVTQATSYPNRSFHRAAIYDEYAALSYGSWGYHTIFVPDEIRELTEIFRSIMTNNTKNKDLTFDYKLINILSKPEYNDFKNYILSKNNISSEVVKAVRTITKANFYHHWLYKGAFNRCISEKHISTENNAKEVKNGLNKAQARTADHMTSLISNQAKVELDHLSPSGEAYGSENIEAISQLSVFFNSRLGFVSEHMRQTDLLNITDTLSLRDVTKWLEFYVRGRPQVYEELLPYNKIDIKPLEYWLRGHLYSRGSGISSFNVIKKLSAYEMHFLNFRGAVEDRLNKNFENTSDIINRIRLNTVGRYETLYLKAAKLGNSSWRSVHFTKLSQKLNDIVYSKQNDIIDTAIATIPRIIESSVQEASKESLISTLIGNPDTQLLMNQIINEVVREELVDIETNNQVCSEKIRDWVNYGVVKNDIQKQQLSQTLDSACLAKTNYLTNEIERLKKEVEVNNTTIEQRIAKELKIRILSGLPEQCRTSKGIKEINDQKVLIENQAKIIEEQKALIARLRKEDSTEDTKFINDIETCKKEISQCNTEKTKIISDYEEKLKAEKDIWYKYYTTPSQENYICQGAINKAVANQKEACDEEIAKKLKDCAENSKSEEDIKAAVQRGIDYCHKFRVLGNVDRGELEPRVVRRTYENHIARTFFSTSG